MALRRYQKLVPQSVSRFQDECQARAKSVRGSNDGKDLLYSCRVKSRHISPNRTRLLRPVHARDAVVVPGDDSHDIISDHSVFVVKDTVDA